MKPADSQINMIFQSSFRRACISACWRERGTARRRVASWANSAGALSERFKADYHSNKSFNLCSKAFLWNWRLSISTGGKREVSCLWSEFFLCVSVCECVLWRWLDKTARHLSDSLTWIFLQIRVINFSGHLMRGRRKEKEGDALGSLCSDVQNHNSIAAIRYPRDHSTLQGH